MNGHQNKPFLHLTLASGDSKDFFVEMKFGFDPEDLNTVELSKNFRRETSCASLCILLLLAKFQGEEFSDQDGKIRFDSPHPDDTWMYAAGLLLQGAKGTAFFKRKLGLQYKFLTGRRGSGHTRKKLTLSSGAQLQGDARPFAAISTNLLPLENLVILKKAGSSALPMRLQELPALAEAIERAMGWKPTVAEIVAKTESLRSSRREEYAKRDESMPESKIESTACWNDFIDGKGTIGQRIEKRLESPQSGEEWFVICIAPRALLPWINKFHHAVEERNVHVKWAYHSPDAVRECKAVRAQWLMLKSYNWDNRTCMAVHARDRIREGQTNLREMAHSAKERAKRNPGPMGSYEFFESNTVHYFMGFMAVPPGDGKPRSERHAPRGTYCVIQPYPMFAMDFDKRPALYLESPSPFLDIYYYSILRFFRDGLTEGFLSRVDLLRNRK